MTTFDPVCVTVALFIALVLFDVIERAPERVNTHIFLGLITTFLMVYLSSIDMELVSWGLLLIPVVILITCYFMGYKSSSKPVIPAITVATPPPPPSTGCQSTPTLSTPESIATASKIIAENDLCKV